MKNKSRIFNLFENREFVKKKVFSKIELSFEVYFNNTFKLFIN